MTVSSTSLQLVANLLQYYSRPCVAAFVNQPNDCLQVRCTSVCCFALAPSSPDQGCFARSCSTKLSFMLKGSRAGCRILNETSWLAGYCCIMHFSGDVFSPFAALTAASCCSQYYVTRQALNLITCHRPIHVYSLCLMVMLTMGNFV